MVGESGMPLGVIHKLYGPRMGGGYQKVRYYNEKFRSFFPEFPADIFS